MTEVYELPCGFITEAGDKNDALRIYREDYGKDATRYTRKDVKQKFVQDIEEFEKKYGLVRRDPSTTESGHDYMLETFGRDLDLVAECVDSKRVWTIVSGDSNGAAAYIVPGYRFVNRIGYILSEKPFTDESEWFWY